MKRLLTIFLFLIFCATTAIASTSGGSKSYQKQYYSNGQLKAEGWVSMQLKTDYWIFYHANGQVASKGHFKNNKKNGYWYFYKTTGELEKEGHFILDSAENWWIFYEIGTRNKSKFQYKNNQKNGFCLRYTKSKLIKAEKYQSGQKMGEWTSIREFRRDNPNVSLR